MESQREMVVRNNIFTKILLNSELYYVDKSTFIRDVIKIQLCIYITRPILWGKFPHLSMLESFLGIQCNKRLENTIETITHLINDIILNNGSNTSRYSLINEVN